MRKKEDAAAGWMVKIFHTAYLGLVIFFASGVVIGIIHAWAVADPAPAITAALVLFWTMLVFWQAVKIRGVNLVRVPPARASRLSAFFSGWGHILAFHPAIYRYLLEPAVILLFAFFALAVTGILAFLF
jgi:xanthosine utilization system XapX-like protein